MTNAMCTFFRSVGIATAAFALAILEGSTQPGVWFPEEVCVIVYPILIIFYVI